MQATLVQGTLLAAAISPDNTPHGYNLTFVFPMLMFIIIAALLYLRFRSPHQVPGHAAQDDTTGRSTLHEGGDQGGDQVQESEDGE